MKPRVRRRGKKEGPNSRKITYKNDNLAIVQKIPKRGGQ